ncbi:MAG: hypothetical protein OEW83_12725, partial [Acidimicrobiia bacterium]|nr:hypothetical protein [Acidimicrobiia bacterium]
MLGGPGRRSILEARIAPRRARPDHADHRSRNTDATDSQWSTDSPEVAIGSSAPSNKNPYQAGSSPRLNKYGRQSAGG